MCVCLGRWWWLLIDREGLISCWKLQEPQLTLMNGISSPNGTIYMLHENRHHMYLVYCFALREIIIADPKIDTL